LNRRLSLAARTLLLPSLLVVLGAVLIACSSGSSAQQQASAGSISIATVTPAVIENGGKPASGSTPVASTGNTGSAASAPTRGKWIDVDVTRYVVRLMNGTQVVQTIQPIAVGANVNTGQYESTQTGLFTVYNKIAGIQYDAPYNAYIADWVAFDPAKDNGFHSFLLDQSGNVTDPRTGRVSNGCIRTGMSKVIFDYAEIGMQVYVHL